MSDQWEDPPRLFDSESGLDGELRELLREARGDVLEDALLTQVRQGVAVATGAALAAGSEVASTSAASTTAATTAASSMAASTLVKVTLIGLATAGVVAGGAALLSPGADLPSFEKHRASIAKTTLPSTPVVVPTDSAPALEAVPPENDRRRRARLRRRSSAEGSSAEPSTPPVDPSPSTELALIREARQSVTTRPRAALLLLREHAARFPAGALVEEREVLEIQALHGAGRVPGARARAERFLARRPSSIHASRVRALLEEIDASP